MEPEKTQETTDIPTEGPAAPQLSLRFKILAMLFITLLGLVAAEITIRLVNKEVALQRRTNDAGLFILYEPSTSADLITEEFRVRVDINQFGHRDRLDRTEKKSSKKKRVLVFGDSFSVGWGVAFDDAYPTRLEKELDAEFMNVAKDGGSVVWYIHQIRYAMERFDGDALVLQVFDNDLEDVGKYHRKMGAYDGKDVGPIDKDLLPKDSIFSDAYLAYSSLELNRQFRRIRRRIKGKKIWQSNYCEPGSFLERKVLSRKEVMDKHKLDFSKPPVWRPEFGFHDPAKTKNFDDELKLHGQVLKQIFKECKAKGYPVFVVYIPCLEANLLPGSIEEKVKNNVLNQQLTRLCNEAGAGYLDGSRLFHKDKDPTRLYYPWDGHLNPEGHAYLAKALSKALKPLLAKLGSKD
ncbi:MAG: SGNH/GDSL hydrolase family protein [Planctomycetota bacterium]|nr:SGNH/GDSL hydrolase family protein [Planctomycetota bacterium]